MFGLKRFLTITVILFLFVVGCQKTAGIRKDVVDLYNKGHFAEAVPLAEGALAKSEQDLGPDDPEVAANLNLLALLYYSLGDFAQAEPLFKRALDIREKQYGSDDVRTAVSLNNLALLYDSMGDYSKAEPLYKRALEIRERNLKSDHPDIAASLNNLAGLYYSLGDFAQAVPLYKRALSMWEEAMGKGHPDVATSLSNLAGLYAALGEYDQAEPLYDRALEIRKTSLGPDHPDTAAAMNNLALLYSMKGDLDKAEPLYEQALKIVEKSLGPDHPDTAAALNNLAMLYSSRGDYVRAEELSKRALAIVEKSLGPDHPEAAAGLDNLAGLYAARGQYAKAHELFKRAQEIDRKLIDQVLGFTSEEKKANFLATKQSSMEGALSLVLQYLKHDSQARKDAFNVWLARKGIILEAQRRFQEALLHSDDPAARKTFQNLTAVRSQLSRLTFSGPGPGDGREFRKQIKELEKKKEGLEAELSRLSSAYAIKKKIEEADALSVSEKLPAGSVLIEFARINIFNFKASGNDEKWLPARYAAFVLPARSGGAVKMVDLGPSEPIDNAVTAFKKAIINFSDKKGSKAASASRRIFDLVFSPLKSEINEARSIYISPDGNLNLLPFEVLKGPDGKYLIEDYTFNYLSAGRDVLGFGRGAAGGGKVLLMGDPDFQLTGKKKEMALARLGLPQAQDEPSVRAVELRGFRFNRLPGTREEVETIKDIFEPGRADLYIGSEALEEVLINMKEPGILHMATHGFFLSDVQFNAIQGRKSKDKKIQYINPLLRSGLALAGANRALSASGGTSDGILTAEKVLGLRLRRTDLVVLSACETGLGEIKSGEGVYGLRRAFTQAGAKSLVMSMWSVPDEETKELMTAFYRNIQSGSRGDEALRRAALDQKKIVEERYGAANPFYWGAFVFLGQP